MDKPRIYLAGKISKNGWRDEILGHRSGAVEGSDAFNPEHIEVREDFIYTGPFFISCDHGCFHGDNQMGVCASTNHGPSEHGPLIGNGCSGSEAGPQEKAARRKEVFRLNILRIERSTHIFAYIEDLTAHGTLFELGAAFRAGKPIGIGFPEKFDASSLWFAQQSAMRRYFGSPNVCWRMFRRDIRS